MSISQPSYSLNELLSFWETTVLNVERGYDLCIYEYLNDVSVRAVIGRRILSEPQSKRFAERLSSADKRFIAATERAQGIGVLRDLVGPEHKWLARIPKVLLPDLAEDI